MNEHGKIKNEGNPFAYGDPETFKAFLKELTKTIQKPGFWRSSYQWLVKNIRRIWPEKSCVEIERKFLVSGDFLLHSTKSYQISQGYLSSNPERTVRVRIQDKKAFMTIKGIGNASGAQRYECEFRIKLKHAQDLLKICEPGVITKTRHLVPAGKHTFEIDIFHGENHGLVLAEIELSHEDDFFETPSWLGEEVTGQERYYNSSLIKNPFSKWSS